MHSCPFNLVVNPCPFCCSALCSFSLTVRRYFFCLILYDCKNFELDVPFIFSSLPSSAHTHSHRHRMITSKDVQVQHKHVLFFPLLNRILNLCCLLFPHTCRFLCTLSLETPEQEVTKFELSRCYSTFVSVHFLYVPCNLLCHIDVIQQQNVATTTLLLFQDGLRSNLRASNSKKFS